MESLTTEAFTFAAADGQGTVQATLHYPPKPASLTPVLIVCHGRWNTRELPLLRDLCTRAAEAGMLALRLDFRYVTEQRNPSPDRSAEIADVEGALAAMYARFRSSPGRTYLAGKSLGAVVVSHVAARHPGLGGCIALGYPLHGPGGSVTADVGHFARLGCPALFVVGENDPLCRPERLREAVAIIPTSCTVKIIPGGDHSFRPPDVPERSDVYLPQALDVTLTWLQTQIGA